MKIQKFFVSVLIAIAIILLGVFFYRNQTENATRDNDVKVRIGYLNIVASLPINLIKEKKLLEENNIKYELIPLSTSNLLVNALSSNDIDFIVESSAVPVITSEILSPNKMKIFAISDITSQKPFDAIISKNSSGIDSLQDLQNKKIGVFPGSTASSLLKKFLKDNNIDISKVEILPIPPENQFAALEAGEIDALHSYEPTTSIALNKQYKKIYGSVYASMLSPNPQGVAVVSQKFLNEHKNIAKKVISIFKDSYKYMNSNEKESRLILSKSFNLQQNVADQVSMLYMTDSDMETPLQKYINMLVELGEIKKKISANEIIYSD